MSELKLRPLKTRVFPQPVRPRRQSGWGAPERAPLEPHIILSGKELKFFALSMIRKCSFYRVYDEILLHEWLPPFGERRSRRKAAGKETGGRSERYRLGIILVRQQNGQDTFCA